MDEANKLFLDKKFEKAIEKYNLVLHNDPDNLVALNNKGYSFSKIGNYSNARICYDECLEKNPEDRIVLINKISLFRKIGEFDKGLKICENILKNSPNEIIVLYHKLRILKKLNKFSESNIICKKLLDIYPDNGDVLYDMASNFLKMGNNEKFLSTLQKAVCVIPNLKNKSKNNKEFEPFYNDEQFLKIVLE